MKNKNKLFIIIAVCLVAVAVILSVFLLRGCGEENNESNTDVSVNIEISETVSNTDISTEISTEISTDEVSAEESTPEESLPVDHTHEYADTWSSNETDHWHECECGDKSDIANHTFGEWETTKEATEDATGSKKHTCSVCGYEETATIPMLSHTHSYSKESSSNETDHWYECACGDKSGVTSHTYGDWTVTKESTEATEGSKYHTCSGCGYKETVKIPVLSHTHKYGNWKNNATSHWKECSCGDKSEMSAHGYGDWVTTKAATCTETGTKKHTCAACGHSETTVIVVIAHVYGDWKYDGADHWKECECGNIAGKVNHTYTSVVTPPTESKQGYTTHICDECGYSYVDSYTDPVSSVSEGLAYEVNSDGVTCTITGIGTCKDIDLKIPSEIDGYKVTTIGESAFNECRHLTSVTIPDSVTTIGGCAFYKCSSLTSIVIPDGVTEIGDSAFIWCDNLSYNTYDNAYYLGNSKNPYLVLVRGKYTIIASCQVHSKTKFVLTKAFNGCTNLTSVTIPDSVTTIGYRAFASCIRLTNVTIPDSVTTIGTEAFFACSNLTDVYYSGSESDWNKINIAPENTSLINAKIHFNS